MSRVSWILVLCLAACPRPSALAADPARSADGAGIPELTVLMQIVNADTSTSTSFVSTLASAACSGFSAVPGPDLVYTWLARNDDPNFPLHLDFFVSPQAGFDAVVYALGELDNGASCVAATDTAGPGGQEMLHVEEQLTPGQRYYLYVDSRHPTASSGSFQLRVSTFIPVELQSFSIE